MHAALLTLALWVPQQQQLEELKVEGPTPALVRLGSACKMTIKVTGPNANPRPPRLPRVDGLRMQVTPMSTSTFMSTVGARVYSERSVSCSVLISPQRVGKFTIPAFRMFTGTVEQTVPERTLEVVKDITGQERSFIDVEATPERVYVNEPVRFVVDYGIDEGLGIQSGRAQDGRSYYDVEIQAPWLDEIDGAVALDDGVANGEKVNLVLNRKLEPVTYTAKYRRGDRTFHRFRLVKSFMPTRSGKLELSEAVLRFTAVVDSGSGIGLFGERRVRAEEYYAYGKPLTVEVLPLPEAGRPADFSGAVGRFTLRAAVDRRQVKVGNSVKLTLTVEGHGNLEFLGLPEIGELPGFHLLGRKENRTGDRAEVTFDLTPLSADVHDIPVVHWSYFDTSPGVERFVEVATEAIPIEILPLAESESLASLPGEENAAVVPGVDDIFDIKPLDDGEPATVSPAPAGWLRVALILAPWLACAGAFSWFRRRRRIVADHVGRRARRAMKLYRRGISAGGDAASALCTYLAARLGLPDAAVIGPDLRQRLSDAGLDEELAEELHTAVLEGTAARYGGVAGLDEATATALVRRVEAAGIDLAGSRRRVDAIGVFGLGLGLWLGAAVAASGVTAQSGSGVLVTEQDPVAAYRRGDYAAAALGFAAAAEQPGADRRLYFNLGNSRYREGRYAEALVAYHRARLAMPRDAELLANIQLVERKLDLATGAGEPLLQALARLRDRLTDRELLALGVALNLIAASLLVFGGRVRRWLGAFAAVPALLLIVELSWLGPHRPPRAIVLAPRLDVVAEPRAGLEPVVKLRQGVAVDLIQQGPSWSRVRVGGRSGYVPSDDLGVIR